MRTRTIPTPLVGSMFGRLTVTAIDLRMPPNAYEQKMGRLGGRAVLTRCECGTEKLTRLATLQNGRTTSCGCLHREQMQAKWQDPAYQADQRERGRAMMRKLWADPAFAADVATRMTDLNHQLWTDPAFAQAVRDRGRRRWTIHGLAGHPLRSAYSQMMSRCYNPKAKSYHNYGARGIEVYRPWHDLTIGIPELDALLGQRPQGQTIDRIDNDGHYEPGNLRWASPLAQTLNRGHGTVIPIQSPPCAVAGCLCS